ncbi:glycosyltransferase family 39 protein [Bacteriovorax sp. Seq25_V]|uniref:glycosyltransferase family 39 protein n=1 Tax=Bacteriovorax sp. Seq25_V TaxID=1201288 RepID=UPI000389FB0F|nr:glycosyltransferase family 39 protein [Bacteriovorax sp. Seq25_V]EQC45285.1 dolichyl-phosphate-mannose-protein mannosyltransferase [Bacteriovorax sp. Seq25_V]
MSKFINIFKKNYILIIGLIFTVIYSHFANNDLILDDKEFIFGSNGLIRSPSMWAFWDSTSGYTRSWPMSYSLLWLLSKVFLQNIYLYKVTNIILHFLNFLLLFKILKSFYSKAISSFAAIIFLIHPMQIESIFWVFQFKTIISITFLFLSLIYFLKYLDLKKKRFFIISILFFSLSLASKITAIFFPLLLIAFTYGKKRSLVSAMVTLPFLLISAYFGYKTIQGVNYSKAEISVINSDYKNQGHTSTAASDLFANQEAQKINFPKLEIQDERFIDNSISRIRIILFTTSFYFKKFLLFGKNSLLYKYNYIGTLEELYSVITFIFLMSSVFVLKLPFQKFVTVALIYLLSHLPVSGLAYVPYMKYSLVADHWAYLSIAPLSLLFSIFLYSLLAKYSIQKRTVMILSLVTLLITIGNSVNYIKIFTNKEALLEQSRTINTTEPALALEYLDYKNKKNIKISADEVTNLLNVASYTRDLHFLNNLEVITLNNGDFSNLEYIYFKKALLYLEQDEIDNFEIAYTKLEQLNSKNPNLSLLKLVKHKLGLHILNDSELEELFNN